MSDEKEVTVTDEKSQTTTQTEVPAITNETTQTTTHTEAPADAGEDEKEE